MACHSIKQSKRKAQIRSDGTGWSWCAFLQKALFTPAKWGSQEVVKRVPRPSGTRESLPIGKGGKDLLRVTQGEVWGCDGKCHSIGEPVAEDNTRAFSLWSFIVFKQSYFSPHFLLFKLPQVLSGLVGMGRRTKWTLQNLSSCVSLLPPFFSTPPFPQCVRYHGV